MDGLSEQGQETRRAYKRWYRIQNREKLNAQQRAWRKKNPDKVKEYQVRYWERRAGSLKNLRASWEDYGLTPERLTELAAIVRADEYADLVLSAAMAADEKAAGHIILSVTKKLSYDHLEYNDQLGRCPLGRTNFYGARRLFFHYLDVALKKI